MLDIMPRLTIKRVIWICVLLVCIQIGFWSANHSVPGIMDISLRTITNNYRAAENGLAKDPIFVLLLSYQRSGSTYVCHLFKDTSLLHAERNLSDSNPDPGLAGSARINVSGELDHVFFLYEPLDPLYTAMFGTQQGWNGPGEIFYHNDGTLRTLPKYELDAVTWYLEKIFRCQTADLPPGILMHKFWNAFRGSMPLVDQYASCVARGTGLPGTKWHLENEKCQKRIRHLCGRQFGQQGSRQQDLCHEALWGRDLDEGDYVPNAVRFASGDPGGVGGDFGAYFRCIAKYRDVTRRCAEEYFDKPCKMASIRALKTVRAKMDVAEYFRERYPDFYVIHSFREPRALTNSWLHTGWAVNAHSRGNVSRIANDYCGNVFRDSVLFSRLPARRRHRILYDDFVRHPARHLDEVYAFLGRRIPASVRAEFRQKEAEKERFIRRADRWRRSLNKTVCSLIQRKCSDLTDLMKNTNISGYFYS